MGRSLQGGAFSTSKSAASTPIPSSCNFSEPARKLSLLVTSPPVAVLPDPPCVDKEPVASLRCQHFVIPEEDPYRIINDKDNNNNDEDEEPFEPLEDGIGVDDDDDEEEDASAPSHKFKPPRPLPTWLKNTFDMHIKESGNRGSDGSPPLYRDHQTFWFP